MRKDERMRTTSKKKSDCWKGRPYPWTTSGVATYKDGTQFS
jgi:hypothetical protein